MRNVALKTRLESILGDIRTASDEFELAAINGTLSVLPTATAVGTVTRDELSDVYTLRLVRPMAPGRVVYDEIIASVTNLDPRDLLFQ